MKVIITLEAIVVAIVLFTAFKVLLPLRKYYIAQFSISEHKVINRNAFDPIQLLK